MKNKPEPQATAPPRRIVSVVQLVTFSDNPLPEINVLGEADLKTALNTMTLGVQRVIANLQIQQQPSPPPAPGGAGG